MTMKLTKLAAIVGTILFATLLPSAFANHRTGDFPLPEAVVAGDFNQDGNLDLAVDVSGFDNVAILIGDGQGGFTLAGHFALDTVPKGLGVGDVNGDGHLDLVTCTIWGYDELVLLGDGLGAFHSPSPPNEITGDGEPNRLLLRDFNHDGKLDIAVNAQKDAAILVYLGNGRRRGSTGDTACSGAASTATRTSLLSISSRSCATLPTRSFFLKTEPAVAGYIPIED